LDPQNIGPTALAAERQRELRLAAQVLGINRTESREDREKQIF